MNAARLGFVLSLGVGSLLLGLTVFAANDGGPSGGQGEQVQLQQEEGTPTPTPTVTPAVTPTPSPTATPIGGEQEDEDEGEGSEDEVVGGPARVTVTNPDGKEMQLPCVSNVVRDPAKHPKWQVPEGQGCEPGPGEETDGNGGSRGGPQRVSMTNPDGKCVQLPVTAGPVRNRQRHPDWAEGCASGPENGEEE